MSVQTPAFEFASPEDASHAVRDASGLPPSHIHELVYNHHDPTMTYWWLTSESENPAYRLGKIVLNRNAVAVEPADLLVGLYVEKGVIPDSESVEGEFRKTKRGERLLMDQRWRWHSFVDGLLSGEVDHTAAEAEVAAGVPLTVVIDGGHQTWPGTDRDTGFDMMIDWLRFTFTDGHLTPLATSREPGIFSGLAKARSFADIGVGIAALDRLNWVWIDFEIGVRFVRSRNSAERGHAWTAAEIWNRACMPWNRWIGGAGATQGFNTGLR